MASCCTFALPLPSLSCLGSPAPGPASLFLPFPLKLSCLAAVPLLLSCCLAWAGNPVLRDIGMLLRSRIASHLGHGSDVSLIDTTPMLKTSLCHSQVCG